MNKNIKKRKIGLLVFLICFIGSLLVTAKMEAMGKEQEEDYMEVFDYLSEDAQIKEILEEKIKEQDEAFLAELEKEALLEEKMERWEYLNELAETIEAQNTR